MTPRLLRQPWWLRQRAMLSKIKIMPFRPGVVHSAALSLLGAAFVAAAIVQAWLWTHSAMWALAASVAAGSVMKGLEAQRHHRRQMLPVYVRYPGSTAV